MVWGGLVWFGPVFVWFGAVWAALDVLGWLELAWAGLDWLELAWLLPFCLGAGFALAWVGFG